jgi:hypothetical protein
MNLIFTCAQRKSAGSVTLPALFTILVHPNFVLEKSWQVLVTKLGITPQPSGSYNQAALKTNKGLLKPPLTKALKTT